MLPPPPRLAQPEPLTAARGSLPLRAVTGPPYHRAPGWWVGAWEGDNPALNPRPLKIIHHANNSTGREGQRRIGPPCRLEEGDAMGQEGMAWVGGHQVFTRAGEARICRSAPRRRGRPACSSERRPGDRPPGAARAASAFQAVGVTSAAAACAHFTLSPSAESACNCVAPTSHHPLRAPRLPTKQQVRSWRGALASESQLIPRRHTHAPNIWPSRPPRDDSSTAPRPPGYKHFLPLGHPSGKERPSLPTAFPPTQCRSPPALRRDTIFTQQGNPRKKRS